MPGDAFHLPENLGRHASLQAKDVLITTHTTLRFGIAELDTGPVTVPVPDYVLNLSPNPNFAQNSLAGANFDASYPFAGSPNALTAFHIRVGGGNGVFGAVEQRFAWDKSYLLGSISPLNHSLKQYNVLGSTTITPTLQLQGFAQVQAFQRGFTRPDFASLYMNLRLTQALKHSYLQSSVDQYYQSLLGDPNVDSVNDPNRICDCYDGYQFVQNHPIDGQISWISFDQKVLKLPLKYRLRSGYGFDHDRSGNTAEYFREQCNVIHLYSDKFSLQRPDRRRRSQRNGFVFSAARFTHRHIALLATNTAIIFISTLLSTGNGSGTRSRIR